MNSFDIENEFYLTCHPDRIKKLLAQHRIYEWTLDVEGDVVECGVFKGASLSRFAMFNKIHNQKKKVIGFDTFTTYPIVTDEDAPLRNHFVKEAGDGIHDLVLKMYCDIRDLDVELVKGDICNTVPKYISQHPKIKISLINMDCDVYEPTKIAMDYLIPRLSDGGIIIFDNYETFYGETKAVDMEYEPERINEYMGLNYVVKLPSDEYPMTYIFDIDGTLNDPNTEYLGDNQPYKYRDVIPDENMIKMVNHLYEQGNEIILMTGRGSTSKIDWREFTENQLKEWGVKYHKLEMVDKPPRYTYVDDMAVSPREFWEIIE